MQNETNILPNLLEHMLMTLGLLLTYAPVGEAGSVHKP